MQGVEQNTPAFDIVLFVVNCGATPAKWFEVSATSHVMERLNDGRNEISKVMIPNKKWYGVWPKQIQTVPLQTPDMLPQYAEAWASHDRCITVKGHLRFITEFNETRCVRFNFHAFGADIAMHMLPLEDTEMRNRPIKMQRPTYSEDG